MNEAGKELTKPISINIIIDTYLLKLVDISKEIMKKIGKRGEILLEESYGLWPLFKLFRETELFLKTYAEIYGYEFSDKVKQEGKEQTRTSLPQVTALEIEINESGPVASS